MDLVNGEPHWEAAQRIADTFYMIADTVGSPGAVDMYQTSLPQPYVYNGEQTFCGTSACHAGWFAYFYDRDDSHARRFLSFSYGAKMMASELGFNDMNSLLNWAELNPSKWGNSEGGNMFNSRRAFMALTPKKTHIRLTLGDIASHWQGVADRLREEQDGLPDGKAVGQ